MSRSLKHQAPPRGFSEDEWIKMEEVRNFLCGYQLCADMLELRQFERRRARPFSDPSDCNDILQGSVLYWRSRMFAVGSLIDSLPNGREKLVLYYHYIHGESIEHIGDVLGVSRRTSYRLHLKALRVASRIYIRKKQKEDRRNATAAPNENNAPCSV